VTAEGWELGRKVVTDLAVARYVCQKTLYAASKLSVDNDWVKQCSHKYAECEADSTVTPARAANRKRCSCASCRVASGAVTEEYAGTSDVAMRCGEKVSKSERQRRKWKQG